MPLTLTTVAIVALAVGAHVSHFMIRNNPFEARDLFEHGMNLREIAKIMEMPMGTVASHFARGKAAVAAYVELTPELERSTGRELTNKSRVETEIEIVVAEVVDNNE